jgi:hypothetical protein
MKSGGSQSTRFAAFSFSPFLIEHLPTGGDCSCENVQQHTPGGAKMREKMSVIVFCGIDSLPGIVPTG